MKHTLCVINQQMMLNIAAVERILPPENYSLWVPFERVATIMSSSSTKYGIPTGYMLRISCLSLEMKNIRSSGSVNFDLINREVLVKSKNSVCSLDIVTEN